MPSFTFFHTLRWKLILTYTTVTILALLALEVSLLLLIFWVFSWVEPDRRAYLSDVVATLPPQVRDFVQPGAVDADGLQAWLQETYAAGYASLPPQDVLDSPAARIVKTAPMYVLAPDGTVLAASPDSARGLVGRLYSPPADLDGGQKILERARQLSLEPGRLSAIQPDGNILLAVPVQQEMGKGPLAAVVIVTVAPPPAGLNERWPVILWIVPLTGVLLLFAVAPFAALFGFVMSRGLTRRLKALTIAVDAWSEGNFAVQPQDRSKDEISYLGLRMRRMAEHIQALLHAQQELGLMEERNRLARELHDTVKQETFATLMQVRAAKNLLERDSATAREHLQQAEELIKTSQQELGLMITELRPAALEGQGLAEALSGYLATWSQHSRIPADLQVQNERRLPLEIEQTLFRVAQEALSNVARHSRASAVTLRLAYDAERVTLCIGDNGVGFDPATAGRGFGLQSMHDRMEAIQGRLVIEAAPDGGVIVTAEAQTNHREQR